MAYYEADSENPWHYVWIGFLGINSQMYTYQLMNSTNEIYVFHNLDINKYKENIFKIIELQGSSTSNYFKANSILFDIMSSLYEDLNFNEDFGFKNSLDDEIKFFLDINYPEKIKIVDIARMFGIHPNYLAKIFSQKYELSPKRYLIELKLKKACKLLTTKELPISIIANSLGFDDQLAFSKIFKKEYSVSPSEYRKMK